MKHTLPPREALPNAPSSVSAAKIAFAFLHQRLDPFAFLLDYCVCMCVCFSSCKRKTALKMHAHSYSCTPPPSLICLHRIPPPPLPLSSFCHFTDFFFFFIHLSNTQKYTSKITVPRAFFLHALGCSSGLLCSYFTSSSEEESGQPNEGTGAQRQRGEEAELNGMEVLE